MAGVATIETDNDVYLSGLGSYQRVEVTYTLNGLKLNIDYCCILEYYFWSKHLEKLLADCSYTHLG